VASQKDSVELTGGRGSSQKIIIHGQPYVLRLYLRGGFIDRFISNKGMQADILSVREILHKQRFKPGAVIKRLHQARIFHADLNANNILVDEQVTFTIIDFDKAQIMSSIKGNR